MNTNDIKIIDGKFEHLGKEYDCKYLIETVIAKTE